MCALWSLWSNLIYIHSIWNLRCQACRIKLVLWMAFSALQTCAAFSLPSRVGELGEKRRINRFESYFLVSQQKHICINVAYQMKQGSLNHRWFDHFNHFKCWRFQLRVSICGPKFLVSKCCFLFGPFMQGFSGHFSTIVFLISWENASFVRLYEINFWYNPRRVLPQVSGHNEWKF